MEKEKKKKYVKSLRVRSLETRQEYEWRRVPQNLLKNKTFRDAIMEYLRRQNLQLIAAIKVEVEA